jgi:hypothetical protein
MRIAKIAAAAFAVVAAVLTAAPGAAHAGTTGARVWYQPGDQFTKSNLWRFDFGTGTGYQRSLQPSLTGWGIRQQTDFTFERSGAEYTVRTFEYGTTRRITFLQYSRADDVAVVDNDGFRQTWLGCRSAGRPLSAVVAC